MDAQVRELQTLIAAMEALLPRIDAAADSEVARLRSKTEQAMAAAKAALPSVRLRPSGRERPLAAVGLTALIALSIGLWAGRSMAEWW